MKFIEFTLLTRCGNFVSSDGTQNARQPLEGDGQWEEGGGAFTDGGVETQSASVTDHLVSLLTGDVRLSAPVDACSDSRCLETT